MQSIEVKLLLSYFSMRESSPVPALFPSWYQSMSQIILITHGYCSLLLFTIRKMLSSSSPQDDSSREIRGAGRHDIDISTIPVWCQRKRQTANVIKPWTCPLALRIKQFWYSAGLCICDSNSVKQRAMKAVQEQICGKSDHRMKAQTTPPPK